jgi:dTDP-D-glucose 4,6-dehydratase
MPSTVQARLSRDERSSLAALMKRLGWTPSRAVREGLRLLAACYPGNDERTIIGQGKFASGLQDLGSNKAYLRNFGK